MVGLRTMVCSSMVRSCVSFATLLFSYCGRLKTVDSIHLSGLCWRKKKLKLAVSVYGREFGSDAPLRNLSLVSIVRFVFFGSKICKQNYVDGAFSICVRKTHNGSPPHTLLKIWCFLRRVWNDTTHYGSVVHFHQSLHFLKIVLLFSKNCKSITIFYTLHSHMYFAFQARCTKTFNIEHIKY